MPTDPIIDAAAAKLNQLGWSTGDLCCRDGDRRYWMVLANRDEHRIVVRAATQAEAWQAAAERADRRQWK